MLTLKKLKYTEFPGTEKEWTIEDFELFQINLLVGKNAVGKTRTLNVVNSLSDLLSGRIRTVFESGHYIAHFMDKETLIVYELFIQNHKVEKETLHIDEKVFLDRGKGGIGKIKAEKFNGLIEFQSPENELASVSRRDSIQHPFFDKLNNWGQQVLFYSFGTPLGKDQVMISKSSEENKQNLNLKDTGKVVYYFKNGVEAGGEDFKNAIKEKMNSIGYEIEAIDLISINKFVQNIPGEAVGICVRERGIKKLISQIEISQGMFRVLSIIIQLEYSKQQTEPSMILIDDIGEGLDFERSVSFVKLLVNEGEKANLQMILATNDRFVMNTISLDYWSLIQRRGSNCKIFNHKNSKETFDEFKYTGLSNFDFLSSDFINSFSDN